MEHGPKCCHWNPRYKYHTSNPERGDMLRESLGPRFRLTYHDWGTRTKLIIGWNHWGGLEESLRKTWSRIGWRSGLKIISTGQWLCIGLPSLSAFPLTAMQFSLFGEQLDASHLNQTISAANNIPPPLLRALAISRYLCHLMNSCRAPVHPACHLTCWPEQSLHHLTTRFPNINTISKLPISRKISKLSPKSLIYLQTSAY